MRKITQIMYYKTVTSDTPKRLIVEGYAFDRADTYPSGYEAKVRIAKAQTRKPKNGKIKYAMICIVTTILDKNVFQSEKREYFKNGELVHTEEKAY